MLFQDAILEFGFDCKVRKLSPKSITNYQKQLRYLQNYLEQEYRIKSVEQVRTAHIKMFLAMMDDRQRKPRYINDLLKAFKTFFNYLKREGHIQENPTAKVKNMKQPKTKILTFSEDEIRRLLNHFNGKVFIEKTITEAEAQAKALTELTNAHILGKGQTCGAYLFVRDWFLKKYPNYYATGTEEMPA